MKQKLKNYFLSTFLADAKEVTERFDVDLEKNLLQVSFEEILGKGPFFIIRCEAKDFLDFAGMDGKPLARGWGETPELALLDYEVRLKKHFNTPFLKIKPAAKI